MSNLRRSVFITFLSTNFNTIVQFGVTLILARLLSPSDIGIFSITIVFVNIIAVFRDFGVSAYLLQEKELTDAKKRTGLGLLIVSSWTFATVINLVSGPIAAYYEQPGIQDILRVITISWMLLPFSSYFYCLLARNLDAGKQALVNGVGTFAYAGTAVGLALLNFSYMSMAWANVANIASSIVVYWFLKQHGTPLMPSLKNWRTAAKFGSGALLSDLVQSINFSLPDLVLGKISGAHAVGLYSRATGLVGIFYQVVGPTINYNALPYIAKNHHAGVDLVPVFSKATAYLTVLSWPAFIVTGFFGTEIIRTLYGEKWVEASPIVVFICLQWILGIGYALCFPALIAVGRPYLAAVWAGVSIIVRLTIVFAMDAREITTFALALAIADVITMALPAWMMSRYLGYSLKASAQAHWSSAKVILFCLPIVILLRVVIPVGWPDIVVLGMVSIMVIALWLLGVVLTRHPIVHEFPPFIDKLFPDAIADKIKRVLLSRTTPQ